MLKNVRPSRSSSSLPLYKLLGKNLNAVKTITTIPIADDPTEPSTHTTFANGPSGLILFL
jgi:hypothetical protein